MSEDLSSLFRHFRDDHDMRMLAKVFDRTAPELAAIAGHLAKSPHDAEDLVQATFLAAIESADDFDADRPLVPWLLGILSMQARKQRERASRDPDPERLHSPVAPDPERQAQASELARAVDAAVGRLDRNYAPLVRRHLLEGAPPAALAREFSLTNVTARVRLHRGLKQLRQMLPAGLAGAAVGAQLSRVDLAALRTSVLRRASELTGAPLPVASLASAGLLLAILVPVAVATPAWFLWRARTAAPEPGELALAPTFVEPAAPPAAAPAAPAAPAALAVATAPAPAPPRDPAPRADPGPVQQGGSGARVRGRLLRPGGSPAAGATLKLDGLAQADDEPQTPPWTAPAPVQSAADGRFELEFAAPPGFLFDLQSELPGCARAAWSWLDLHAGSQLDLGDVQLEPVGSAVVRIVNAQGEPLVQGWSATARFEPPPGLPGRKPVNLLAQRDAASSTFALEGLAARSVKFQAQHGSGPSCEPKTVDIVAGQSTAVELVYSGPDLRQRISVRLRAPRTTPFLLQPAHVWLEREGAPPREMDRAKMFLTYSLDGLEPGTYRVRVEDPRLADWSREGLQPGEFVVGDVAGNARMRVSIFEPDQLPYTGRYLLKTVRYGNGTPGGISPLVADTAEPPEGGIVSGVFPGSYELELTIPGRAPKRITVANVQALETRDVSVAFGVDVAIDGRVLAADGETPMPGVDVQLTRGTMAGHLLGKGGLVMVEHVMVPGIETRKATDASGKFHFGTLQAGAYTLRAAWSRWLVADRTVTLPDAGAFDLVQPRSGFFRGRLLLPEGVTTERIVIVPKILPEGTLSQMPPSSHAPGELNADGTFRLGPLPECSIDVSVMASFESYDEHGTGTRGTSLRPGVFTIVEGEGPAVELDLRSTFPAQVHGTVRIDGAVATEGRVHAGPLPNSGLTSSFSGSALREGGSFRTGGITPNAPLELSYRAPSGWSWTSPAHPQLAPGSDSEHALAVETIEREIQVLDAQSQLPVAGRRLVFRTGDDLEASLEKLPRPDPVAQTDAQGKLRVRLPAGPARPFALSPQDDGPGGMSGLSGPAAGTFTPATIEWTAGSATIVLRFAANP